MGKLPERRRESYSTTQAVPDSGRSQEKECFGYLLLKKPNKFFHLFRRSWKKKFCNLTSTNLYYRATSNSRANDHGSGLIPLYGLLQVELGTIVLRKDKGWKRQSVTEMKKRGDKVTNQQSDEKTKRQSDENMERQSDENMERKNDENMERQSNENMERQSDENMERQSDENMKRQSDENMERQSDENMKRQSDENMERQCDENMERQSNEKTERQSDVKTERLSDENMKRQNDSMPIYELRLTTRRRKVYKLRFPKPDEQHHWLAAFKKQLDGQQINLPLDYKATGTRSLTPPSTVPNGTERTPIRYPDSQLTIYTNVSLTVLSNGPFNISNNNRDNGMTSDFEDRTGGSNRDQNVETIRTKESFSVETAKQQDPEIQTGAIIQAVENDMNMESVSNQAENLGWASNVTELIQHYECIEQIAKEN